jgi:hypothetical protein
MSYKTPEYERIDEEGHQAHEELKAILDEHLPPDTVKTAWQKIDAISQSNWQMADYNDKRIYRALMGLVPEHSQEVRAAFLPVVFDGSQSDEKNWVKWESGVEWAITPDYIKLLNDRMENTRNGY